MVAGTSHVSSPRIFCSEGGFDLPGTLHISDGRITALDGLTEIESNKLATNYDLVLPGLIDLHCHLGSAHSVFGVDPSQMLNAGTTLAGSQGDAGALTVDQYAAEVISPAHLKIKLAINLSQVGESMETPCFSDHGWIDIKTCIEAVDRHRDIIWAIAVNASHHACPELDPVELVDAGLKVANETGLPILYGMRRPEDWALADQLAMLRKGDVVTYCFRKSPHCIVSNNRVLECVLDARKRGVLFDVGHGCSSFDFDVAETAVGCGFLPDTISTDLQVEHFRQQIRHDLPLVMSKLRAVGMLESDIFRAVTVTPAKLVGETDRGQLTAGSIADLTMLKESKSEEELIDTSGNTRLGKVWTATQAFVHGKAVFDN